MPKKTKEDYGKLIRESFQRWEYLMEHGSNDPNWPDGVNINLVINHIIYYKRKCEEEMLPPEYPKEYYWDVPVKVPDKYMVKEAEIRKQAKKSIGILANDPNYIWLKKQDPGSFGKSEQYLFNPVFWMKGFVKALQEDNLVEMRRAMDTDRYLETFRENRKKIEAITGQERSLPLGQLSIFDFI